MSNAAQKPWEIGPQSFSDELHRISRAMHIYSLRHHLAMFPRDLLRRRWDKFGDMPNETTDLAFRAYKAGLAPRRRLYKGRPYWPQLKIIEGGKQQKEIVPC
jgi:hypothetical protein